LPKISRAVGRRRRRRRRRLGVGTPPAFDEGRTPLQEDLDVFENLGRHLAHAVDVLLPPLGGENLFLGVVDEGGHVGDRVDLPHGHESLGDQLDLPVLPADL